MIGLEVWGCDLTYELEGKRPVKVASGNPSSGLSKKVKIPTGYTPRGEGQGQRPTEECGKGSKK